ncbi:unnamed protein product [Haemonchus placei]|uniref:MFS domain-containing protein n=1 Tax=Haemonchus placei TaxID=6290 RepID=A0A158QLT2_HAEPC|nr:unnamed protein product [Haemonchus placei]
MTCSVVVDGSGSTTRLRSPERNHCFKRRARNSIARDFGHLKKILKGVRQSNRVNFWLDFIVIGFGGEKYGFTLKTWCLMDSTGINLNGWNCVDPIRVYSGYFTTLSYERRSEDREFRGKIWWWEVGRMINIDFHSLLMDWGEACQQSALTAFMSTSLMAGALTGSFTAGWLADTYGRLPVLKGCLLLVCIINGVFSIVATVSWVMSAAFMFTLGAGCGGYMVTNLVLLVESLDHPGSRLLGVSLNGWSFSMIFVALLARFTRHWFLFHLLTSAMALVAFMAFQIWVVESCRWLASVHRNTEAHSVAIRVVSSDPEVADSIKDWQWWEILGFSEPAISSASAKVLSRKYTYADLFRFYFNADALPGNRYVNMAIMGFSKFVMGLIPFAVSPLVGRRPIVSISVGVACLCAWLTVISQSYGVSAGHWSLVAFSLIVSAALDPAWKINHLYSAELFPTVVRNMARAVCNVGARLGSVLAPMVVHLRTVHYLIPYLAFAVFLTVQLVVVVVCIPETKDRPLPEELPPKRSGSRDQQMVELNPATAGSQIHEPT